MYNTKGFLRSAEKSLINPHKTHTRIWKSFGYFIFSNVFFYGQLTKTTTDISELHTGYENNLLCKRVESYIKKITTSTLLKIVFSDFPHSLPTFMGKKSTVLDVMEIERNIAGTFCYIHIIWKFFNSSYNFTTKILSCSFRNFKIVYITNMKII